MTNNQHSEPLIRIIKKDELSTAKSIGLRVTAFFIALVAGGLFILVLGQNPIAAYGAIIKGAIFSTSKIRPYSSLQSTIQIAIPLLLCALGLSFSFKMKFWNIGAEGQLIMGAVFATYVALNLQSLPKYILIPIMFMAGAVGGALWALIPTLFKVKFGTNETLFTLMLNYIALYIIIFLRDGLWKDPSSQGFPQISKFSESAQLPTVFGVHIGWIIALVFTVLTYIYLTRTKQGYEISVVGESLATARYAGMNVKKIIIRTMLISGAISGVAGMIQVSSLKTLTDAIAGGRGFIAITIAWLAQLNPFMTLVITVLFSVLQRGCETVSINKIFGISSAHASVLQAIILFCILGCEFFVRYKFVLRSRRGNNE